MESFFNVITSVLSYVWSILKTLWFWLTSLLTWLWDLINQILSWSIFDYVWSGFVELSKFIWTPAVVFIASLFLIILLRVWMAFVFKILRLNVNYKVKKW